MKLDGKKLNTAKKKKKQDKRKNKRLIHDTGEALTVSANSSKTYAEMLKHMKENIDPTEIGVEVNEMRRTKAGELLIKIKSGEGKAELLKEVIANTLGDEVTIRTVTKNSNIDIRDMDESVEERDIIKALMIATETQNEKIFKVLNIRESYGKTKQALIQMPLNIATQLVKEKKIKIGWIRCRIRAKEQTSKCFKCLDQGHFARECTGTDRSNLCRRCCEPGHKSKDCKRNIRCILCQEDGLQEVDHYIGSAICVSNRRKSKINHD